MPLRPSLVDLREHPLCERPMRLLLSLERAVPGDTLLVVNDHDAGPLFQELKPILEKRFTYWASEAGPETWRTFISCEEPIRGQPPDQEGAPWTANNHYNRESSLKEFTREVHSLWGNGNDPELPFKVKALLEKLLTHTSPQEPWIAKLIQEALPARELYRDRDHGFILMGHVQPKGHNNTPHDHGPCWVVYGVYHGAADVTTYRRTDDGKSERAILEMKDLNRLTPEVVVSCLPGEIHSVFVTEPSVVLRFLSADLNLAKRHRYICDGVGFRSETVNQPGRDLC